MNQGLFGLLTVASLALMLLFATVAAVFVWRMQRRAPDPIGEEIGSAKTIMAKIGKREPMSNDELVYARQVVADRTSPMALAIPAMIFSLGCFYVFGSLEHLHGATPSERTFIGVIPMLTSTNLALRLLSSHKLKRRLA